ncbi:hypothetical protein JTB14_032027 [Gonioctena quinquepunctata]|nr:hypothetical protein JTB14_032027 [Gonioctena quinquepunctata]
MSPKEYSYPAEPDISLPRNVSPRPQNAILDDDEKKISNVRHGNINTRRSATTDHQPEGAPGNNSQGSKERSSERKVYPNKYPIMKANYYDSHQDHKKIQKIVENYEIIPDSNYIKDTRIPKSLRSRPNSTKVSLRLESSDEKNRQTSPLSRAGKRSELTAKSNLLDENLNLCKISKSNSIGKGDSIIAKNKAKLENMTQRMKTSDFSIDNKGSKLGSSSIPKSEENKQIFESAKSHITTSDVDQNPPDTISPLMHMFLLDENEQSERCIVSKKQDEHYNNRNESIPYSRKENTFPGNSNSSSCGQNGATKKQLEQKCNPEQHELPFFQKKLNRTQSTSLNKKVKRRYCNENSAKPYKKLKTLDTPEIIPNFPEELNRQEKASPSRESKENEEMISTEPSLPKLQKKYLLDETEQIRSDDKRQTENDHSSNMSSLEKQLVMENTNDCKYGQNSEVPISDKLESGQKTSCMGVVTFTFSKIHNGYLQKDELEKIEVSAKGNFEKIIGSDELSTDVENEKLLLTSTCRIDCNYMSPGIDFEHNEKNCEDHPEDSGGNGGSGKENIEKDTSKLVLKVMLPKHPCAFQFEKKSKLLKTENGQSTDGTKPQEKKCDISKDEAVPGKLKKKAIIKLNRNFESSKKRPLGKFRSKPHPLEVSKTEHGKDNSKIKEREEIDRFKTERSEVNGGIFGKKVIDLEDMYASVHLKIIMNKYRVDTEQLHYLNDQNVGLPEVEILERKKSRENISKAFNEDIRKKHNETIGEEIKCFDENVGTNDSMAMKKILTVDDQSHSGVKYRSKSRNKTRVNYLEGASNKKIDNDQNNRKIGGIYNKFKSDAQESHLTLGNEKERHTRNTSNTPSATFMKDRESESIRNETNSSDSLQYQLEYVNRLKKQTPENENKRGKGISDNKIYDKTGFGKQGELMRKLNAEKYNLQNIVKEYMVFEIEANNYPNKYLLEYQVPACFLDSAESRRMKKNTSGKETIKNMIVHKPSQSTYLLERQVLTQKLTPKRKQEAGVSIINNSHEIPNDSKNAPNIEFINQIEKERRNISEATIEEILPKKNIITEPVDFGKNIVGTDFSTLFPCKIIGLEEYHKRRLVAKIEKIFDLKNKNASSDSRNEGNFILNYKSMCKSDQKSMKSRSFNKFFVADQKNEMENSERESIRDEQYKKMYRKVRRTVLDLANVEKNRNLGPASKNESIVSKQKKYTTKIYSPENNNVCYTEAVVEKVLPVYPPKQQDTLKRPVTKFCHQVQIPPQSISEVFFSQPCYDINTLSKKNRNVPVISISKKSDRNFEKQNNITFLKIRKDEKNENKHSLPALITRTRKDYEFEKNREHILKLRYELLKKLQEEFKFFNDNQVGETLQNCKKRNGTQEFASVDYKEKRDLPIEQTKPKNNTEMLLEKLSKNDPSNGKYDSKEPKGDPEKK